MTELELFRKGLRRIDEGGLNRIMSHGKHGFIVISANRSEIYSDNPNCDLTREYEEWCEHEGCDPIDKRHMDFWLHKRNESADKELHKGLKYSAFSFTPIFGGYHGEDGVQDSLDPSYIVYCHAKEDSSTDLPFKDLYDFALQLAKKYKQDSVYVQKPNNTPPVYVNERGEQTNSNVEEGKVFRPLYHKAGPSTLFERMKRSKLGEVFIDR